MELNTLKGRTLCPCCYAEELQALETRDLTNEPGAYVVDLQLSLCNVHSLNLWPWDRFGHWVSGTTYYRCIVLKNGELTNVLDSARNSVYSGAKSNIAHGTMGHKATCNAAQQDPYSSLEEILASKLLAPWVASHAHSDYAVRTSGVCCLAPYAREVNVKWVPRTSSLFSSLCSNPDSALGCSPPGFITESHGRVKEPLPPSLSNEPQSQDHSGQLSWNGLGFSHYEDAVRSSLQKWTLQHSVTPGTLQRRLATPLTIGGEMTQTSSMRPTFPPGFSPGETITMENGASRSLLEGVQEESGVSTTGLATLNRTTSMQCLPLTSSRLLQTFGRDLTSPLQPSSPNLPSLQQLETLLSSMRESSASSSERRTTQSGIGTIAAIEFINGAETDQIRAVKIGPVFEDKVVYANTITNAICTIHERVDKKQRDFTMTKIAIEELTHNVMMLIKGVFTKSAMEDALGDFKSLYDLKSKKWSLARVEQHHLELLQAFEFSPMFKANVKAEPMPRDKTARIVIDEGGASQVRSLLPSYIIEKIIFKYFKRNSIKGRKKRQAMSEIIDMLNIGMPQGVVEGDGSAWDTCCNSSIRDLIENKILRHVVDFLNSVCVASVPDDFNDGVVATEEKKKIRVAVTKNRETALFELKAIRRSGDRFTSVFNFITNMVLTLSAIFHHPFSSKKDKSKPGGFLDPSCKVMKDRWGIDRHIRFAFEGDDSIYSVVPMLSDSQMSDITLYWNSAGFNMKIFQRCGAEKVAEFAGWILPVMTDGRIIKEWCTPDIRRGLSNSGISVSQLAIQSVLTGEDKSASMVAAASYAAYAFESVFPTLFRYYSRMAAYHGFEDGVTTFAEAPQNMRVAMCVDLDDPAPVQLEEPDDIQEYAAFEHMGLVKSREDYDLVCFTLENIQPFGQDECFKSMPLQQYTRSS